MNMSKSSVPNPWRVLHIGLVLAILPTMLLGQAGKPSIYVSIVTHNEEPRSGLYPDFVADETAFWQHRAKVVEFACMLSEEGVEYNYQSDWNFLLAAAMYDTGTVSTNEKIFLRFLKDDLGFGIDPHAHESSHNYADVAYLIDSLGVEPSNIAGGFICFPPVSSKLEYFREILHGWEYEFDWKAEVLWGGATSLHQDEDSFWISGIWKPQDNFHFLSHDNQAPLPYIGGFKSRWGGLDSLLILQDAGELNEGQIYTQTIMITQINLVSHPGCIDQHRQKINDYAPYTDSGLIQWVQLGEVADIWHDEYGSRPSLYSWVEGDITPEAIAEPARNTHNTRNIPYLEQITPNPISRSAVIRYQIPASGMVSVVVYDATGRHVRTLVDEYQSIGEYVVVWDAEGLASGVHFCRLRTEDDSQTEKLLLLR